MEEAEIVIPAVFTGGEQMRTAVEDKRGLRAIVRVETHGYAAVLLRILGGGVEFAVGLLEALANGREEPGGVTAGIKGRDGGEIGPAAGGQDEEERKQNALAMHSPHAIGRRKDGSNGGFAIIRDNHAEVLRLVIGGLLAGVGTATGVGREVAAGEGADGAGTVRGSGAVV
jgi:hypothetical protein